MSNRNIAEVGEIPTEGVSHADARMVKKHDGHLAPSYGRAVIRGAAFDLASDGESKVAVLRPAG